MGDGRVAGVGKVFCLETCLESPFEDSNCSVCSHHWLCKKMRKASSLKNDKDLVAQRLKWLSINKRGKPRIHKVVNWIQCSFLSLMSVDML